MQEVAVVQGLQAQVVELQIALGLERRAQACEVELQQALVEQLVLDPLANEGRKTLGVTIGQLRQAERFAQHLLGNGVQQQARGDVGVVGVFLDQRAGGQDGGLVDLFDRHAVIQVAQGLGQDRLGLHVGVQTGAGLLQQGLQGRQIKCHALALVQHVQHGRGRHCLGFLLGALLRAALAIQHVGARHLVLAAAHQGQLDLVLHVLDGESAAGRARAHQRAHHGLRQGVHVLAHAGGGGALRSVDGQEGLHHGHGDLGGFEAHHGAVAPHDLVVGERFGGVDGDGSGGHGRGGRHGGRGAVGSLHAGLLNGGGLEQNARGGAWRTGSCGLVSRVGTLYLVFGASSTHKPLCF